MRLLLLPLFLLSLPLAAQTTLTESLRQSRAGQGNCVIQQSEAIERAVNEGNKKKDPAPTLPAHPANGAGTSAGDHKPAEKKAAKPSANAGHTARGRHRARGYRICIFTGGNSRNDKTKALQMGQKCRNAFPELSVYTTFQSPRWVTHVGDFRNAEEAAKYVKLIKRAGFTYETRIVSSEVNLPDKN